MPGFDRSPWDRASWGRSTRAQRTDTLQRKPTVEGLEGRQLLTTAIPDIRMTSATTRDSQSVSFAYDVLNGPLQANVTVGVYRSADATFSPDDLNVGSLEITPGGSTVDQAGNSAAAAGSHEMTLPIADGLPPNPDHPYVLVVADPGHTLAGSDQALHTAEFRTHVIGVITHGGVQPKSWKNGPPWELRMARNLHEQGYDTVIAYNWVTQSNHPGAAIQQVPNLTRKVNAAASAFPATDPVDVHFIGHSEGAVINGQVIQRLQNTAPPQLQAGYIKETMLDPHAANNGVRGPQYSVASGFLGWVAKTQINDFQSRAKDPLVVVPSNVDDAEVFYQHTPANQAESNNGLYNLWGQVPVAGPAHYYDLTGHGISHAGRFGVQDWYRLNVVPTLAEGAPLIHTNVLTIQPSFVLGGAKVATSSSTTNQPTYNGTAAPGATVRLFARTDPGQLAKVGQVVTGADGNWSLTTRPLATGRYRVVAIANVEDPSGRRPIHMRPTAWANPITIGGRLWA